VPLFLGKKTGAIIAKAHQDLAASFKIEYNEEHAFR
jgi:hypothetical protein